MLTSLQSAGLILALCSLSTASPVEPRTSCSISVDNFDNYTTVVGAPELSPITFNGGLFYNAFDAAPGLVDGVGIMPASSPNVAAASANQDLTKLNDVTLNPFGTLSTANTATKFFELVEFFYACVVFDNGVAVPTGCVLEIFGYDTSSRRVGSATYGYAPGNEVAVPMSRAILPLYYINLKNVTFAIAQGNVATAGTVLYIDNVTTINCH